MVEGGRQDGYIHVLPDKGEDEGADALGHHHQLVVVCGRERTVKDEKKKKTNVSN